MGAHNDLYARICSFENIEHAYRKARKGKRGKEAVAKFEYHLEEELLSLRNELLLGIWRPGRYHNFNIHHPKRRLISAAPFRDRVVHHALCNIIGPLWERRFIFDSYANRVGKGTHCAILRCQKFARRFQYVLQCDIEQFFPSVDHQILEELFRKVIDNKATLDLMYRILASGANVHTHSYRMHWFPNDDLWAAHRPRGLPIGNLTSQFWANVYLNPFDHFIKRELQCPAYLRYVDDFLLFADDKRTLWRWKEAIEKRVLRFRMTLHPPQVFPVQTGIPFLGFRIFPTHRRLKSRRGLAFRRRFRQLHDLWTCGLIELDKIEASARGWAAHAAWGDTYALRQQVLGEFNPEVK